MSKNLYMNLYVQQIFNEEPCKNDLVIQLTTFVFPMPCRKEKHGIFFSQWSHFRGIIDVRHFVGFLFWRNGKKIIQQAIYFPRSCVRILTEYRTCHLTYQLNISSINLMLGHVTSSVPCKNSSVVFFWGFFCVSHCIYTIMNHQRISTFQFCSPVLLGTHRNPNWKQFLKPCESY